MEKSLIHPLALVDPKAELGKNVTVGPFSCIGPQVHIGDNCTIDSHVSIRGRVTLGADNNIGAYCAIGFPAQDKVHKKDQARVEIGQGNDIREFVTINLGTFKENKKGIKEEGLTKIGNHNFIMSYCHFGHDTRIGDHCMLANNSTLAGHVKIGSYVVTGGFSGYHQFTKVGDYCMIGAMTAIYQDVVPYVICSGYRGQLYGINNIGLSRNGFSKEEIAEVQSIYNTFFCSGLVPGQAIKKLKAQGSKSQVLQRFLDFIDQSERGLVTQSSD